MSSRSLEVLEEIVSGSGEPDDVLRCTVAVLAQEPGIQWAGVAFLDEGELKLGPTAGAPDESLRQHVPVTFQGSPVGELWVDGEVDRSLIERVALLVSAHVLIGWDTAGESWEP